MKTDITELAPAMKAAAEKATPGPWGVARDGKTLVSNQSHPIATVSDAMHRMLTDGSTGKDAEFIALANPSNVIALVEALEKAQQRIDELLPSNRNMLMPALGGLSRDHLVVTIQTVVDNYSALHTKWLEDRQRIAELESRTVKLPDFRHEHFNSNWGEHDAEAYQVAPREALTADGIKWEAE